LDRATPISLATGLSLSLVLMATGLAVGISELDSPDPVDPRVALAAGGMGLGLFFTTLVVGSVLANYAEPFFNHAIVEYNDRAAEVGCPNP